MKYNHKILNGCHSILSGIDSHIITYIPSLIEASYSEPHAGTEVSGCQDIDAKLEHHGLGNGDVQGALNLTEELHNLYNRYNTCNNYLQS